MPAIGWATETMLKMLYRMCLSACTNDCERVATTFKTSRPTSTDHWRISALVARESWNM